MTPALFAKIFLAALLLSTTLQFWLTRRHMHHVARHRAQVPTDFAGSIGLDEHQKAADYTLAKSGLTQVEILVDAALVLLMTLGGLLDYVDRNLDTAVGSGYLHGLLLFAVAALAGSMVGLPFSLWRTFRIEARFGFNKITLRLWLLDLLKGTALSIALGAPLLLLVLWLMDAMGEHWWIHVWLVWMGFNLLVLFLYPTLIAPIFNRFLPLQDDSLKLRIEALLARCGFAVSGLFVMDGSRRSSHGNAYFSGFGRAKRIVFFDTLLDRLAPAEIDAVLAHELGHFRHRHILQRIVMLAVASLAFLWLLAGLMNQAWFFEGLGVHHSGTAQALLLFSLVVPVFLFPLAPLSAGLSRRHEYQADAYAAQQTSAADLVAALVKLYRDNAATLTPDPLHSLFHDSHPPAAARIAHLRAS